MEFTESTELLFQPMKKLSINDHWKTISHVILLASLLLSFYNQTWILCPCLPLDTYIVIYVYKVIVSLIHIFTKAFGKMHFGVGVSE